MAETANQYEQVNPVLLSVMQQIYQSRQYFPIQYYADTRLERVNDRTFCQMFFLSKGCSHDAKGGCTMCNYGYGRSYEIDEQIILESVQEQAKRLPSDLEEIVLSPIGSILDDEEVSPQLRENIFNILSHIHCREFTCETRVDSITKEKLRTLKMHFPDRKITLELGIETMNLWCLRNCINKNSSPEQIRSTIQLLHEEGIYVCANVGVGLPFCSEKCNIKLAVQTIAELLSLNVECIVLFPYNVRPGTLLELLHDNGLYSCVSLWTIPEILSHFSDEDLSRMQISWYRNYYQDKSKILHMPTLCSSCRMEVLALLDQFRNHPGSENLQPLLDYSCACRQRWKDALNIQPEEIAFEHTEQGYRWLAERFSIDPDLLERELLYMKQCLTKQNF